EQSIIPEVAATVPVSDDPTLPVLTFRFWVIGTFFSAFAAAIAQFMYFRAVQVTLNSFAVILMSYPVGFYWPFNFFFARGTFIGGSLNPGPYNIKEHTLIVIAATTNINPAYATDILAVQRIFYGPNQDPDVPDPEGLNVGWTAAVLLLWTTQCVGYGFAGLCRSWLVYPAAMWWPSNLVTSNLLHVFHNKSNEGLVSERVAVFRKLTCLVIMYEFLPQYFAPVLAKIAIGCYMLGGIGLVPQLVSLNQNRGGGLGVISLDWQNASVFAPLYTPLWAQINQMAPMLVSAWIVAPIMYKANIWDAQMYPLAAAGSYAENGTHYQVRAILNADRVVTDAAYKAYSPLRLTAYWALMYGCSFACVTSVLTHTALFHGKEIAEGFRSSRNQEQEDVHMKMMRKYPEVPSWWYFVTLVLFLGLSIFTVEFYTDYQLRWWGILFAMVTVIIFIIPIGIVQAISNIQIGTNVVTEFIFGLAVPGQAIANVCFKTYGYTSLAQALSLVSDLKLGIYMKIPPKAMFVCQLWATIVGAIINYNVLDVLIRNVPDIWLACHGSALPIRPAWDSNKPLIFYTASLIWGAVGPARMFGPGSLYYPLLYFFLIGAVVPVPVWLLHRRYPKFGWEYLHFPILFLNFGSGTPSGYAQSYIQVPILSYLSQYYAKRYRRNWYDKYNYTVSAALDSGTIVTAIALYLVFSLVNIFRLPLIFALFWWIMFAHSQNPSAGQPQCRKLRILGAQPQLDGLPRSGLLHQPICGVGL
ncbi:OPT oligopeptide transporter protein-domain-containing protein, partial [Blyttiomyces helicus]